MSTFVRSAVFAAAVLAGLAAAEARDHRLSDNSVTLSTYDLNDSSDAKAFWEQLDRNSN